MLGHSKGAAQQVRGDGAVVRVTQEKRGQRSGSARTEQRTHHRSIKGITAFQIVIKHGVEKGVQTTVIGSKLDRVFSFRPRQRFQYLLGALVGVLILKSEWSKSGDDELRNDVRAGWWNLRQTRETKLVRGLLCSDSVSGRLMA